jgi:hypothetical protein
MGHSPADCQFILPCQRNLSSFCHTCLPLCKGVWHYPALDLNRTDALQAGLRPTPVQRKTAAMTANQAPIIIPARRVRLKIS